MNRILNLGTQDDIPEILCLYHSLIGTPGCTWDMDYPNLNTIQEDIATGSLYTLKEQGHIIAVMSLGDFQELSDLTWKPKKPCELARIGVTPTLQNQGIGTFLLQSCFTIAKKQGYDGIRILVAKKNTAAIAFYTRNGFERCGEVYRFDLDFYCYQISFDEESCHV